MNGLVTIVPTRGRPEAARAFADEYAKNKQGEDTDLIFGIDSDDPLRHDYAHLMVDAVGEPLLVTGPRIRMGPTLNKLATRWANHFGVVGFAGDDHRVRTPGFDLKIIQVLEGAPGVAYGDDLIRGSDLPTACWVSSSIIKDLGYMAPPGLRHMWLDNAWMIIGQYTNLHYLPEIVVEHLHPIAGKAEWDEGYIEANNGEWFEKDRQTFESWRDNDAERDMRRAGLI